MRQPIDKVLLPRVLYIRIELADDCHLPVHFQLLLSRKLNWRLQGCQSLSPKFLKGGCGLFQCNSSRHVNLLCLKIDNCGQKHCSALVHPQGPLCAPYGVLWGLQVDKCSGEPGYHSSSTSPGLITEIFALSPPVAAASLASWQNFFTSSV